MEQNIKAFDMKAFVRSILIIAIPVALQNLLTTTGSMVDTIMLASIGSKAVGAVGLCAQFSSLMFSCYWGFVGGGMLFFAQYWGARDRDGIDRAYGLTFSFMSVVGLTYAVIAILFPYFCMSIYTDNEEIRAIGVEYLKIVGFSYPLQIAAMAMSALLRSTERVKIPLYGGIAAVLTNFTVNYCLIHGKFGFPALGVRGAAIGTVVSALANVLVILFFVVKNHIPFVLDFSRHFRWTREFTAVYLHKCFPVILNELLVGVGNMLINMVLGHQNTDIIAAVAVFRTLEGLIIAFFTGFANATTILVGKKVGEGDHETAYQRAIRLIYLCSLFIGLAVLLLILVHTPLLHAMSLQGNAFKTGTYMLIYYGVISIIRMGNWAQNDTFRAAGDAAFGSIMEITFMFGMVIPCVYLANYYFHAPFWLVFAFCYADEPIRYVIMQFHLYSGRWIRPVTEEGKSTIAAFREKHGIRQV